MACCLAISSGKLGWADVEDAAFGDPAAMRIDRTSDPVQAFQTAMDDDFNTAGGLAVLFDLAKELRRAGNLITHAGEADTDSCHPAPAVANPGVSGPGAGVRSPTQRPKPPKDGLSECD
jgi:hypothetical protein